MRFQDFTVGHDLHRAVGFVDCALRGLPARRISNSNGRCNCFRFLNDPTIKNRRGTRVTFHPDPEIFGTGAKFDPERLFRMLRAKAYLFAGVEIRWHCAKELLKSKLEVPEEEVFKFPGGLSDFLLSRVDKELLVSQDLFAGGT